MSNPTKRDPTPDEEAEIAKRGLEELEKMAQSYLQDGMKCRTEVLHASLYIEERIDELLTELLGVEITLPLERKISVLALMAPIDSEGKSLLNTFRLVRNKLVHEKAMTSYSKCFEADDLKNKRQMIISFALSEVDSRPYRVDNETDEELLRFGFKILTNRIVSIVAKAEEFALKKQMDGVFGVVFSRVFDRYRSEINHPFAEMVKRVANDPRQHFVKGDLYKLIEDQFAAVREFILKAAKEERDKYFREKGYPLSDADDQGVPPPPPTP